MVITNEVILPTEEELTVPEVNLSSSALRAGAFHLGKHCEKQNLVHDSPRPPPSPEPKAVYPDATPGLPDDYPKPPAKYGSRFVFLS